MRPIKFRLWNGKYMLMSDIVDEYDFFITAAGQAMRLKDSGTYNSTSYPTSIEQPYKMMQFTGIVDKYGNEIYEDDIVRITTGDLRKIVYEFNMFKTIPLDENYKDSTFWYNDIEVIGNIHENPQQQHGRII